MESRTTTELLAELLPEPAGAENGLHRAQALLDEYGGLGNLFREAADPAPEMKKGLRRLAAAIELCRRRQRERLVRGEALTSPAQTLDFLQCYLSDLRWEAFIALFLDTRHRVITVEKLFQGSIDGACVYPRVVAERALRQGAAAVIVAHNHPSGVAEPSLADQAITRRLKEALAVLEIRLLDHFIIGEDEPVSLAGRGML
jgi:DNA repair protein RadC